MTLWKKGVGKNRAVPVLLSLLFLLVTHKFQHPLLLEICYFKKKSSYRTGITHDENVVLLNNNKNNNNEIFIMREILTNKIEQLWYSPTRRHIQNNQKHKRFRHMVFVWCRREIENNKRKK